MKKLMTIFGLAAMIFGGCSNPVENSLEPMSAEIGSMSKELDDEAYSSAALISELYVVKEIDGAVGGAIVAIGNFVNAYGDSVRVDAKLVIPVGAFIGVKTISIRSDKFNPVIDFQPASNFYLPLKLSLKFKGYNLLRYGMSNGISDFCYLAPNGVTTLIKNDGVSVNLEKQTLEVKNANITHFSRYGFIRKSPKNSKSSDIE